ncbi:hypothetical protein COLO4_13759 [Corchorus olitorius]|uniref:Uncharacterized protein n=1 Tax=Corchorus olitorius TaxID=93759 RepID=A0A1R3JV17_9ROSI|nr:hypothetical protein COLO4_13759 [Corchorus olitorius]
MAVKLHRDALLHSLITTPTSVPREYHQISLDLTLSKPRSTPRLENPAIKPRSEEFHPNLTITFLLSFGCSSSRRAKRSDMGA